MGVSKYIIIAMGVALAISAGGAFLLFEQNQVLHEDVATEKANVQTVKGALKLSKGNTQLLADLREEDQVNYNALAAAMLDIEEGHEETKRQLRSYRNRLDSAALRYPDLIGRKATRATAKVMQEYYLSTGGKPDVPED